MEENRNNNNSKAVLIGFVLVILVVVFTFARPALFGKKDNNSDNVLPSEETKLDQSQKIEPQDLMDRIKNKKPITIIDVRDAASFQAQHIIDSQNIPLDQMDQALSTLDKNKDYIIVDQLEDPALADLINNGLSKNGFKNIFYLSGGLSSWRDQNFPLISDGDPYSFTDQSKVKYIKSDELKKAIDGNENLYILDVRKNQTYLDGHIKNAANIFLDDLEKRREEIPLGKKIVLVDNDGLWAYKGAVRLFDMGMFNVFALSDGLDAWKQKGYEIAK